MVPFSIGFRYHILVVEIDTAAVAAYVMCVDNRASVAHVAVTPAAFGLCIAVFAVLVAAADA